MAAHKERATGTAVAAVCGFLTGSFVLSIALLQYLLEGGLSFVPSSPPVVVGCFVAGFVFVGVSMGVFTMRPNAQKLGVPVHLAAVVGFSFMTLSTFDTTSIALVGAVMAAMNGIAAVAIVASKDVVVDGRTDTSDDHATDIGTGFH